MTCAPSEDSDQPGHPPSLIRVFAVPMKKAWILSYPLSAQRRLWSDWVDAQAELSLCWAHMPLCWFFTRWLMWGWQIYVFHSPFQRLIHYVCQVSIMHLSMFSPRVGLVGIPWGLDCQNCHCPREFDRRLWHRGGTLDVSARKSQRNYVKISRQAQGILDTKLCHMDRELDPNFSKLFNSLG